MLKKGYIFTMTKNKNHQNSATDPNIPPDDPVTKDMETIATRYLNLWQDNLRHWTTARGGVQKRDD